VHGPAQAVDLDREHGERSAVAAKPGDLFLHGLEEVPQVVRARRVILRHEAVDRLVVLRLDVAAGWRREHEHDATETDLVPMRERTRRDASASRLTIHHAPARRSMRA